MSIDLCMLESFLDSLIHHDLDKIQQAEEMLTEFILKPDSIYLFLNFIDKAKPQQRTMCLLLIGKYMAINYTKLNPENQNKIINRLFDCINFTDIHTEVLYRIFYKYIKNNLKQVSAFFKKIDSLTEKSGTVFGLIILSKFVDFYDKDSPILIEYKDKFFNYCLLGLKSGNSDLIDQSIKLYVSLKEKKLSISNEQLLDIIIDILPNYNSNFICWEALSKLVSKKLVPQEKIDVICYIAYNGIQSDQFENRRDLLFFLLKSNQKFDKSRFFQILDYVLLVLQENDGEYELFEYFNYLAKNLKKNSTDNIYDLLIQKINQLLLGQEYGYKVLAILIYIIVFKVCFKEFYADIDSFVQNIHTALDENEDLTNLSVCYVLNNLYQSYFGYNDFIAIEFLQDILNILPSENYYVMKESSLLFQSFLDSIETIPPTFCNNLLDIRLFEKPSLYYLILTKVIEMDKTIDSNQLELVANHIIQNSQPDEDYLLNLIVILMKKNKNFIDILLPFALENIQGDSKSNKEHQIEFINLIYFYFGSLFDPKLQSIEEDIKKMIYSCEKEFNDTFFVSLCSMFAKNTGDKRLASQIEKICIKNLMNYDPNIEEEDKVKKDNEIDNEDENEDENEDNHSNTKINIEQVFNSCCNIIKLLDEKDLKVMLFHVNLFIINANDEKIAGKGLIVLKKLLHNSCDEDKQLYLSKCNKILDKIFTGTLKALNGNDILSESVDINFLCILGEFISMVVRYQSPYNDTIINFILKVLKTSQNEVYYPSFISTFFDLYNSKTCPEKVQQEIVDLMAQIIKNAKVTAMKKSIAFSLIAMAQYDEKTLKKSNQFVPVLINWYHDDKNTEFRHQELLTTIASALFVFVANGSEIDTGLLIEIFDEFPSNDKYELSFMIKSIMQIFTSNKLDSTCLQKAAFALSKLFLLDDFELKKKKVPPELMDSVKKLFISFSKSDQIKQSLIQKYKYSDEKITKLESLLNQ